MRKRAVAVATSTPSGIAQLAGGLRVALVARHEPAGRREGTELRRLQERHVQIRREPRRLRRQHRIERQRRR